MTLARAVFLDRDGVLIEDVHLIVDPAKVRVLPGVVDALTRLKSAGFKLVVVTNQTVVARGLATEADVAHLNRHMAGLLTTQGAPALDAIHVCPHHPKASLPQYRQACECRKPAPGMLVRAARELGVALSLSYLVGDRLTDIAAGARAGCRTALVETGRHVDAPIESAEPVDPSLRPDHVCRDLAAAADWILGDA